MIKPADAITYVLPRLCVFLPRDRRMAFERRLRGREESRRLRESDVAVVSFGKSGRTWLRLMLSRFYQLEAGIPGDLFLEFDNFNKINPDVPKIFFTHGNYIRDYLNDWRSKEPFYDHNVLLLVRDPRDTAVSQYFQWNYRMKVHKKSLNAYPPHGEDISIYEFVMNHEAGLKRIIEFLNGWAEEIERTRRHLIVRYEDLRAETEQQMDAIFRFFGTPATSAETVPAVVEYARVENMRKLEQQRVFSLNGQRMTPGDADNPDSFKVRRAKVAGYRDYFDPAQLEEIDALVASTLAPIYGYHRTGPSAAPDRVALTPKSG